MNQENNCAKGNSKDARNVNSAIDKARSKLRQDYDVLASQHQYVSAAMLKLAYKDENNLMWAACPPEQPTGKSLLEVTNFVLERKQKRGLKNLMAS